jgi:hypothetical protein
VLHVSVFVIAVNVGKGFLKQKTKDTLVSKYRNLQIVLLCVCFIIPRLLILLEKTPQKVENSWYG